MKMLIESRKLGHLMYHERWLRNRKTLMLLIIAVRSSSPGGYLRFRALVFGMCLLSLTSVAGCVKVFRGISYVLSGISHDRT
jgi:hypothetical protein